MKYIIIEISDKKRKNTTMKKIKETLSQYDLNQIDKVIFFIKDLFYPPISLEQYISEIMRLRELVFHLSYYTNDISVNHLFSNVPEVEIILSRELKKICQYK